MFDIGIFEVVTMICVLLAIALVIRYVFGRSR